jgi:mannan endo-1,4-beta-mannosidase
VFSLVEESMQSGSPLAGTNFWAWGGFAVSTRQGYTWMPGDPFMGDPPQEPQGLNSVFAGDTSTLDILKTHAEFLRR